MGRNSCGFARLFGRSTWTLAVRALIVAAIDDVCIALAQ
jgi:hypothetical protein